MTKTRDTIKNNYCLEKEIKLIRIPYWDFDNGNYIHILNQSILGTLSMDALNLSQKVYNFLNRIVISGGSYRDWLETVYTGGNYMERCETPTFEGGVSQEIVFQEVVSNSASGDEPLGTLAGRGVTTGRQKGGHTRIKVTEPCYIMCICSITPRMTIVTG